MFINDLFKLSENSNEEYYAVYNQRGRPMIMQTLKGKTARAYAEEKNLTIKGGPFDSHQETESFWIRSVFANKRKEVDEQAPLNVPQGWQATTQPDGSTRISKQGSMSSAEYKQNMADYKAKNWTPEKIADYSQRMASGQGYTDAERQANLQQQQQHFGKYADTGDLKETEPTTNQSRTGLSAEQRAQLRKDVDAVDYNKQQQPPAAPSREQKAGIRQAVSDYKEKEKEKVKEQDVSEEESEQESQRRRYPNYYKHKDTGTVFRVRSPDGTSRDITPDNTEEWDDYYRQQFPDLNTPNDGGFWNANNTAALVEQGMAEGGFDIPEIPRAPQPRPEPKNKAVGEDASKYMDTNPGSVTAKQADELGAMARKAFRPDLNPDYYKDTEPTTKKRDWDYDDPGVKPIKQKWMEKNLIDKKPMTYQQGIDEDFDDLDRFMKDKYGPKPSGGGGIKRGTYGQPGRARGRKKGELSGAFHQGGGSDIPHNVGFDRSHSERSAGRRMPRFSDDYDSIKRSEVDEGLVQDRLYRRHQELRKKRGAPDPEYYRELKATFDLPDEERFAKAAELKKKYKVSEAGPFGYGAKKPKKGSVSDLAAKKRQEQEKNYKPIEPKDQMVGSARVTNEDRERYVEELERAGYEIVTEAATLCPECGGAAYADEMLAEKQDACYHKVKSRYKVWPSAYASGALVRCRKKGAANWGNKSKKINEI